MSYLSFQGNCSVAALDPELPNSLGLVGFEAVCSRGGPFFFLFSFLFFLPSLVFLLCSTRYCTLSLAQSLRNVAGAPNIRGQNGRLNHVELVKIAVEKRVHRLLLFA